LVSCDGLGGYNWSDQANKGPNYALVAFSSSNSDSEDGYCNGRNLPGAYVIGNSLHYQDLEWYEALEDSELKDEALRSKAIMEGLISDDVSSNDC
ncbi:hypothetical protein Tco_0632351, partial [Tanacetum coccineum]